jgi:adenosine deaminase
MAFFIFAENKGMSSTEFANALSDNDINAVTLLPKSDLHNHSMLGSRFEALEKYVGKKLQRPPARMQAFHLFEDYLNSIFKELIPQKGFFTYMLKAAFQQAKNDGIRVLQLSIDSHFYHTFPQNEKNLVEIVEKVRQEIAPDIHFIPQLGMDRTHNFDKLTLEANTLMDTGYFKSIDLYGDESYGDINRFVPLYKKAKQNHMTLSAHAGEYGTAGSVREAAELLELQQVQHGIGAVGSSEVMKWIAENNIMLNVCPTSNVVLCRAESISKHPIRQLFDHGIKVTVNTDDLLVFGNSVSEEYMSLYREGVFSADELELIRQNGLNLV